MAIKKILLSISYKIHFYNNLLQKCILEKMNKNVILSTCFVYFYFAEIERSIRIHNWLLKMQHYQVMI